MLVFLLALLLPLALSSRSSSAGQAEMSSEDLTELKTSLRKAQVLVQRQKTLLSEQEKEMTNLSKQLTNSQASLSEAQDELTNLRKSVDAEIRRQKIIGGVVGGVAVVTAVLITLVCTKTIK